MPVTITHSTLADGTFSATGAAAWDATHTVSGLGTMAEQNSNNVNITGGSITGVTGVLSTLTVNSTPTSGGAAGQIMFDTGSVLQESADLVWDNVNDFLQVKNNAGAYQLGASSDVILTRRTAANLRLGATDAAAPVAQTLSVQSVVAGTSNTAGANLTITGSQGTGTGAGGNIIFQVAPAGSTGTAQNALVNSLVISPSGSTGINYTANGGGTGAGGGLDTVQFVLNNTSANSYKTQVAFNATTGNRYAIGTDIAGAKADNFFIYAAIANSLSLYIDGTNKRVGPLGGDGWALGFWSGTGLTPGSFDTILTRRGAANLRFGAADAAAPVAQTLSVQSVVAGTSNTAGANLTITGSQGTGTGAGGNIIFQTSASGASGTAQNALSTVMTLSGGNQWIYFNNAEASLIVQKSSVAKFALYSSGSIQQVTAASDWAYGWSSTTTASGVNDTNLTRKAANNIRLGLADAAAPVAQTLSVQSVVAGTSNTAGANLTITGSQGTGTGVGGDIIFQTALAGSSGTAQNSLITALRIYSNQTVAVGKAYTVATLPAAGTQGRRAWVTDATAPIFLGALTGGGAVVCPVIDNGTAWVAG